MDRYGVSLMWKVVPHEMVAAKVPPMYSYDRHNSQGGVIWGWKSEVPLTDDRVKRIMFGCIKSGRLTFYQLDAVRKAFSYAYQLQTGTKGGPGRNDHCNYPCMHRVWKTIDRAKLPASNKRTKAEVIPTFNEMKSAFRRPWTRKHPWCFLKFICGMRYTYDTFVCGLRPNEDVKRVKKSTEHFLRPEAGYGSTAYVGGRCKNVELVPWKLYTVCFCPGGVHVSPDKSDHLKLDNHGNPRVNFKWHSTCPLASFEYQEQFAAAKGHRYAKINSYGNGFQTVNESDPTAVAIQWLSTQGIGHPEVSFSHNSGRKTLARLLSHCEIDYPTGFEVHADRHSVWQKDYQPDCMDVAGFTRRTQHTDPDVCCAALRRIANKFGLGVYRAKKLTREGKLMAKALEKLGEGDYARKVRLGLDTESESESEDDWDVPPLRPSWLPKVVPPAPRKKKRCRLPELDEDWTMS